MMKYKIFLDVTPCGLVEI